MRGLFAFVALKDSFAQVKTVLMSLKNWLLPIVLFAHMLLTILKNAGWLSRLFRLTHQHDAIVRCR